MIGAQHRGHTRLNRVVIIFLFALAGIALGSCGKYGDESTPESIKGDTAVRKQYLNSLSANGLAQKGEETVHSRNYKNFQFEGCTLRYEKVKHQVSKVNNSEVQIAVTQSNPSFASEKNAKGQDCKTIYEDTKTNQVLVLNTQEETEFRRKFIEDGCDFIQGELGKSLPDLTIKDCTLTFAREKDFDGYKVGSAKLEANFKNDQIDYPVNRTLHFFINKLLWVNNFEDSGVGIVKDSEGDRRQFSYNDNLSKVKASSNSAVSLETDYEETSVSLIIESIKKIVSN